MNKIIKYTISISITVLISYGLVAAWNGLTASDGDTLDFTKWNQLVEKIQGINSLPNGYVGIGVSNPKSLLNVVNNIDRDGPGVLFGLNQPANGINPWSGLDLLTEGIENFHEYNGSPTGSKGWRFTAHNTSSSFNAGDLALWNWNGTTFKRYFMVDDVNGNWLFGPSKTPVNRMDINGNMAIGSNYAGTESSPVDGLIIEGKVGIGISEPKNKLHIQGGIQLESSTCDSDRIGTIQYDSSIDAFQGCRNNGGTPAWITLH